MAQRAVAIRALGWRLRVEAGLTNRFGNTMQPRTSQGVVGQSPLPRSHSPIRPFAIGYWLLAIGEAQRYFVSPRITDPITAPAPASSTRSAVLGK